MLPAAIALLNLACALLLAWGLYCIKRGRVRAHRAAMLSAFGVSLLFLAVYLVHHWRSGIVYYPSRGSHRTLYLWILGTHTPLAAIVPILALVTLTLGLRGRYRRHRRWARWTWPIWMYVSISGIAVYWMLYR